MKIKKIILENNPIFWSRVEFDFTKNDWSIYNNILLIGENWSWKSTLLDIIFDFSNYRHNYDNTGEIRIFDIELSDVELLEINQIDAKQNYSANCIFKIDSSKSHWRGQIEITNQWNILAWHIFHTKKEIFKWIYSTAEISFNSNIPNSVTNKNIDETIKDSIKSPTDLANQITQLLVDIRQKDNEDSESYRDLNNEAISEENRQLRTKRFKNAFIKIFSDKLQYCWVKDLKPVFKKWIEEFDITKLSSWEKQIVFRWWFLLKDQNSLKWSPVLIDEPEISLHPSWQLNILDYYRTIFTNPSSGQQTSQIFFTTHSPYVLKSYNSDDFKIFIFDRDGTNNEVNITPINLLWKLFNIPTRWEINRYAYWLPTLEFHDELYWYLHDQYIATWTNDQEKANYSQIPNFDQHLKNVITWMPVKQWDEEKYHRNQWFIIKNHIVSLSTFIRHKSHHPENKTMQPHDFTLGELKQSIEEMIKLI